MIRISFLGLDRYIVGAYSKEATRKLAKLYEVQEEEIVFYAPESFIFHDGVEQTSYQVIIEVRAPKSTQAYQEAVAGYLLESVSGFVIHVALRFEYFENNDFYEKINRKYSRFLDEKDDDEPIMEEVEIEDEELYEGDIFAGFDEEYKKTHPGCDCDEDDGGHGHHCKCGHHHD